MKAVTPERFIEVWSKSKSALDVAAMLQMSVGAARARASLYRKAGVKLKHLTSGRPALNADRLNAVIRAEKPVQT